MSNIEGYDAWKLATPPHSCDEVDQQCAECDAVLIDDECPECRKVLDAASEAVEELLDSLQAATHHCKKLASDLGANGYANLKALSSVKVNLKDANTAFQSANVQVLNI